VVMTGLFAQERRHFSNSSPLCYKWLDISLDWRAHVSNL
jgi:hypothetical protein